MDYREKIQASIEYIEENLSEELTLEELAKQALVSKFYYHRLFHEEVGEPVMAYIRKRRLTEAAKELREGHVNVLDVAIKYQFGSQEAFSRAFKRMFHIAPGKVKQSRPRTLQRKEASMSCAA